MRGNQTNPQSSVVFVPTYRTVAPVLIDAQTKPRISQRPKPWASIHPASEHVSGPKLTTSNQFKDTNRSLLYGSESYIQYLLPDWQAFIFCARCIRCGQHIRTERPKQTRRENGIIHNWYCFSKQGICQLRESFDAETLHFCFLSERYAYIPAMFGILSFSLYRYVT
jgi:hypothetical protein